MLKKLCSLVFFASWLLFTMPTGANAFTLLTKEQALEEIFGKGVEVEKETQELHGEVLSTVKKRLGDKLVYYQEGSESERVATTTKVDFYFGSKEGKRFGVAIIDVQPGKWGPVTYIIAMTLQGAIKKVRVMEYVEKRGRPIARRSYMRQYEGKTSRSTLQVGRDITGISGATISSRATTFAVTKAIVLYEELYLK